MVEINITLLIQLINFLIVYWLLKMWFFRPLFAVMDERKKLIEAAAFGHAEDKDELQKLEQHYNVKMRSIYREASQIKRAAREKAELEGEQMLQRSKQEAAEKLAEMKRKLDEEFALVRKELGVHEAELQTVLEAKIFS